MGFSLTKTIEYCNLDINSFFFFFSHFIVGIVDFGSFLKCVMKKYKKAKCWSF